MTHNPDNTGHGHVFPRPDGVKAQCGGPGLCKLCSDDLATQRAGYGPQPVGGTLPRAWGVSRDLHSPGQRSVIVSFERALTDDELRELHKLLGGKVVTG